MYGNRRASHTRPTCSMSSDDRSDVLARLGVPASCELGTRQQLPAGHLVISEGRPTRRFVLVVSGELCVCGDGRKLASVGRGDWCGEIGLLCRLRTNDGRATATVRTKTDVDLISFAPWEFKAMLDAYPEAERRLVASAGARIDRFRPTPRGL